MGELDTKANPNAIPEYLDAHFKQKEKLKKERKMMGADMGADLQEKIREMEEASSIDKQKISVGDFKRKKKEVMEQTYM